jgi:hypothetical protein
VNDNIDSTPYSTPIMLKTMRAVSTPYGFVSGECGVFEEEKDE